MSASALALAVSLELAGHALTVKDGKLIVGNGSALTPEQRAEIQAQRRHLMALAAYEVPV